MREQRILHIVLGIDQMDAAFPRLARGKRTESWLATSLSAQALPGGPAREAPTRMAASGCKPAASVSNEFALVDAGEFGQCAVGGLLRGLRAQLRSSRPLVSQAGPDAGLAQAQAVLSSTSGSLPVSTRSSTSARQLSRLKRSTGASFGNTQSCRVRAKRGQGLLHVGRGQGQYPTMRLAVVAEPDLPVALEVTMSC